MASDFSRTLALLRREKRISQRTAAGDLQVSQALLSHYENGLREPGLSFVVRAADYYGVSCDYLLGRSLSREGSTVVPSTAGAEGTETDPETELQKKLITDSASVLLDAAAKSGSRQLVQELASYLSAAEYKLFRYLYAADSANPEEAFRTRAERFDALCDARMKLTELRVAEGAIHAVRLKQKSKTRHKKKISAAIYEYQVDCDGEWGEISLDFENGTAEIIRLADWDTMKTNRFANKVIAYLLNCENEKLPTKTMLAFEP